MLEILYKMHYIYTILRILYIYVCNDYRNESINFKEFWEGGMGDFGFRKEMGEM